MPKFVHIVENDKGIRVFSAYKKAYAKLISELYARTYDDGIVSRFENDKGQIAYITKHIIN